MGGFIEHLLESCRSIVGDHFITSGHFLHSNISMEGPEMCKLPAAASQNK